MQLVSEIMTRNVQTVSPRESLRRAAQIMDELNVGALPVCEDERLVGMVTDRDITVRATSAGLAPDRTTVDEVMSADVRWCFEDQPLDEVMQQMADTQIRRVPVVSHDEEHRLVGIVSLGDLATKSGDAQERNVGHVVEKVSSPSEPERDPRGGSAEITASDTGTATGLLGSDYLDEKMNPDTGTHPGADPSDVVEVTPDQLVNRHAPDSTTLTGGNAERKEGVTVRHTRGDDSSAGVTGVDAVGASGASGGTAGGAGSPGTGIGAKP